MSLVRSFTLVREKNSIYFSTRIYFFYFTYILFKNTPHQIIYFILHFIKISIFFFNFINCFSFFTHKYNHHLLSSFILEMHKERINN